MIIIKSITKLIRNQLFVIICLEWGCRALYFGSIGVLTELAQNFDHSQLLDI